MSLWLAGSKPESVYVSASAFDPEIASCGDFDQVIVTIKFRNGVISSVENGRVAPYGYDQRLEVSTLMFRAFIDLCLRYSQQ